MTKIVIYIIVAIVLIGGVVLLVKNDKPKPSAQPANVSVIDGKQIIAINAKGGYQPRVTVAQANMPTVIKVKTNGTFDCSSAITIPSLRYRNFLPPSGEAEIEIPPQQPGAAVRGICAMGMYSFAIQFN